MANVMLTTSDNPFNPFTQFDQWNRYDMDRGYHTCAYLARVAITSDELSEPDHILALETAIDEIAELNLTGNYRKVTLKDFQKS